MSNQTKINWPILCNKNKKILKLLFQNDNLCVRYKLNDSIILQDDQKW